MAGSGTGTSQGFWAGSRFLQTPACDRIILGRTRQKSRGGRVHVELFVRSFDYLAKSHCISNNGIKLDPIHYIFENKIMYASFLSNQSKHKGLKPSGLVACDAAIRLWKFP